MGTPEDTMTPAGRYLTQRMNDLGFRTKADLADTANVSRSTITRLFKNADYRPDVDVMRRLARGLQVEHDTLVAAIYGEEAAPAAAELHPLAAELSRMLTPESPLSESTKALQELLVDLASELGRKQMRTSLVLPEDAHTRALIEAWKAQGEHTLPVRDTSDDATLNPSDPVEAKLLLLKAWAPNLHPVDRDRLVGSLGMLLEWLHARIEPDLPAVDRVRPDFEPEGAPKPGKRQVGERERHDAGR